MTARNDTTSTDARRAILEQVAAGELSPEEAAGQLAVLEGDTGTDERDGADLPPAWQAVPGPSPGEGRARRIVVRAALRSVVIEGDGGVAEASPAGGHRAFREGDALVISAEPVFEGADGGFSFNYSTGRSRRVITRSGRGDMRPLRIRVNPDLPLDATLDAGSLAVRAVRSPITLRVSAGSAKVEGFASPLTAQVNAGSLSASGRIDSGASSITCDAGAVKLHLEQGSSVRMRLRSNLGKITLPDGRMARGGPLDLGAERDLQVGDGDGTLDVTVNLGKISITSDDDATDSGLVDDDQGDA